MSCLGDASALSAAVVGEGSAPSDMLLTFAPLDKDCPVRYIGGQLVPHRSGTSLVHWLVPSACLSA